MARDRLRGGAFKPSERSTPSRTSRARPSGPAPNPYAEHLNSPEPVVPKSASSPRPRGQETGEFWDEQEKVNKLLDRLERTLGKLEKVYREMETAERDPENAERGARATRKVRLECLDAVKLLWRGAKSEAQRRQARVAKERLEGLLNRHRNIEKAYEDRTKARVARQYRIVKPAATDAEIENAFKSDNHQVFAQALRGRMGAVNEAFREVKDRQRDILEIEKSMTELVEMFQEMSLLVEQQEELVEEIETHAVMAAGDIEAASKELSGAIVAARKSRKKRWCCFGVVFFILCAVAVVLVLKFVVKLF